MLLLNNGCRCSEPSIFPKNWNRSNASIIQDWRLQYYFYDPINKPDGKLFVLKGGINKFKTLTQRRQAIVIIKEELIRQLLEEGYNPITGRRSKVNQTGEIDHNTGLSTCLQYAFDKIIIADDTRPDLRSMLKYFNQAAVQIGYSALPIKEVKRKHIKAILEQVGKTRILSGHRFNKYRTYLSILFSELLELELVESNIIKDIKIQKTVAKIRDLLTVEERKEIHDHLYKNFYSFWRFLQVFFHSGGRIKELLQVKICDVDVTKQRYKTVIRKGKNEREVWRTIKNIVLPLWQEIMQEAADSEQFLFAKGLKPGHAEKPIRREQITRRWQTHVKAPIEKGGLGVTADFYSLKHLNLDETAATLDIQAAADMAGHTTSVITMKHYAIGEKDRRNEKIKKVNNPFA